MNTTSLPATSTTRLQNRAKLQGGVTHAVYPPGTPVLRKLNHWLQYVIVRAAVWLVQSLPYRVTLSLAWLSAVFVTHVLRLRRRETVRRLRSVFGASLTDRAARRIAARAMRNFCFAIVDTCRNTRLTRATFDRRVDASVAIESIAAQLATGGGAILATPHIGAWETAGTGLALYNLPLFVVAGQQRNRYFDAWLQNSRRRMGYEVLMRGAASMRSVLHRLQSGEVMAVLPDVRMRTEAVPVRFLGGTANLGAGMAHFARLAKVPIFPGVILREGWSKHRIVLYPPIWADHTLDNETDIQRMTQAVMDVVDAVIREHPDQWFWFNKRWVLEPVARRRDLRMQSISVQEG